MEGERSWLMVLLVCFLEVVVSLLVESCDKKELERFN